MIAIYIISTAIYIIGFTLTLHDHLHYMKIYLAVYIIGNSCVELPFLVYYIVKYRELFAFNEQYIFCEKYIDKVNIYGSRACFSITITDSQGRTFDVVTQRIYFTNWKSPNYKDFYQKKVTVAYNPETEQVVIIKK